MLTLGFIAVLFGRDIRRRSVTGALWIPFIWLFLTGSRHFSEWLAVFGFQMGGVNVEDGSPVDSAVYGLLILAGFCVLYQRRVSFSEVAQNNRWLIFYLAYCFLAILWSEYPLVSLKRWLKVIGHPVMVMVILTEPNPEEAIIQLLKRCAYAWIPISILFIKYFPQFGRGFDSWTGMPSNTGITTNKNMLGLDLFILCTFFFWYFLKVRGQEKSKERRDELILIGLFGCMIGWLFHMAHSATAIVGSTIASALILIFSSARANPRYITGYLVGAAAFCVVGEGVFGLYTGFLGLLGRNPTLTDRTLVWHTLLQAKINPILGTGFESFWLGEHIQQSFWPGWAFVPNEAHNCYLETYLNLGLIGLVLMVGWMITAYYRARRDVIAGLNWGRFRLGFIVAIIFYNWTEANFRGLDPLYFLFFLISMDFPRPELATAVKPAETEPGGAEMALAIAKAGNPVANNKTGVVMN